MRVQARAKFKRVRLLARLPSYFYVDIEIFAGTFDSINSAGYGRALVTKMRPNSNLWRWDEGTARRVSGDDVATTAITRRYGRVRD